MPQRIKSSVKADSSQSEVLSQKRTKRLRAYSDDDEDESYESHQERRTSYNESYTRGGTGGSSPPAQSKRQKVSAPIAPSSDDGEESDYETQEKDYDDRREVEEEEEEMSGQDDSKSARGSTSTYMEDGGGGSDNDDDGDGYGGGRLSRKRRTSDSSPFTAASSWRNSSPPAVPPPALQTSVVASPGSNHPQQNTAGRNRKLPMKARQMTTATTKKSTARGKQKAQNSTKRKQRQGDEYGDEEEYNDDYEDEEVNVDEVDEEDEARFSDGSEEYEEEGRPARGKKGHGGGGGKGGKARENDKHKDMAPILKKAKFEGNPPAIGSTTTSTQTTGTKRPRTRKPTGEDTAVDIMDETGTPDLSSMGSPTATPATEGGKGDTPASSAPPAKKRKLPTIKKLKNTVSLGGTSTIGSGGTGTGPSTPSSIIATGSKPLTLPPPLPGGIAGNGVNKLGIAEASKARPKTNATTDLDLSNPSLYAELFKNPGGNASRTGLNRRAKEEERKRELDKMREEYKAKFAEESKKSFDLQGQAEKMARFEEVLRHRRSSALYPNFLAAKWREEWEREKRRAQRRDYQQQAQPNGHADNTKEEGEM